MFLLGIALLGEIVSLLICLYIDYFGEPRKLFNNYNTVDGCAGLYLSAIFAGWILFPFFIYVFYRQIKLEEENKRKNK